jgi:16S rRNA (cytosine1402-N4)-methyltransferase
MQSNEHKRRIRYKGTHPKSYETKYKELDPLKYQETIEKIISKGMTPAGTHRPICVNEILDFFDIKEGQIGLDATLGYGGHSLEILKKLNHTGHLYALDQDPIEIAKTTKRLREHGYDEKVLTIQHLNFSEIDLIAAVSGPFDFILADLGVSSMQIDNPDRGFSYKTKSPLDLRMNPNQGIPASEFIKTLSKDELIGTFIEYSDEPYAKEIAITITTHLYQGNDIQLTSDLYDLIKQSLQFLPKNDRDETIKKSAQRVFQAIRIAINNEMQVLYDFLEKIPHVLKPGGKVAILTFHSGEDRLVKKSYQHYFREGIYKDISNEPIRPSMEEQSSNSRSKSAKLRFAIKK